MGTNDIGEGGRGKDGQKSDLGKQDGNGPIDLRRQENDTFCWENLSK